MADFEVYMNDDNSAKQLNREYGKIYNYNNGNSNKSQTDGWNSF